MELFTEYIQPLTAWLYAHPYWALFFAFFISFSESLAIVGSIVPGSITMTAIGILAGTGIMRIDLTLLAATLGAVAGDNASYLIGYVLRDKINQIWPFSRYPHWLLYGKEYFERHGGKSVIIGRFIGPLRSIIPVIAGMMRMPQWYFFITNVISAIGWSILYVLPGVLIGAAGSQLSPDIASRFFTLIILLLIGLWGLYVSVNWLLKHIHHLLDKKLHLFWLGTLDCPYTKRISRFITPADEVDHYYTALFAILILLFSFFFISFTLLAIKGAETFSVNFASMVTLQSLRSYPFDAFFIYVEQLKSPMTLMSLSLTIALILIYYRDWYTLPYWISLNLLSLLSALIGYYLIKSPKLESFILPNLQTNAYPMIKLTILTALFSALFYFFNTYCKSRFISFVKIALLLGLLLAGIAPLYLGDNWFTDSLGSYLLGLIVFFLHVLPYRKHSLKLKFHPALPYFLLFLMVLTSLLLGTLHYKQMIKSHQYLLPHYVLDEKNWWNQKKLLLPLYHTNRMGRPINLFNVQYAGSLNNLEEALRKAGWVKQNDSLLNSITKRLEGKFTGKELPFISPLYLTRKPVLIMSYRSPKENTLQILRIWRSNYYLNHYQQTIWLGSMQIFLKKGVNHPFAIDDPFIHFQTALIGFQQRMIFLHLVLPIRVKPILLLVKP